MDDRTGAFDGAFQPLHLLFQCFRVDGVDLGQGDDFNLVFKTLSIGRQFPAHDLVRFAGVIAGGIDEMQQHAAALDMAKKTVAKAMAFMRALDQAGNVGQHEFLFVDVHDAEARMQRGEGIIGDFRTRGGDRGEEGRFARVRQADEAGVGDQLQPKNDIALLAILAGIGAARRAIGRGGEMQIAETAIAALADDDALADLSEIGDQGLAIHFEDLGALGHFQHGVGATAAMTVLAHAMSAGLGLEMLLVTKVDQRVQAFDAFSHDIAAASAVAAVGTAELDEFLTPERHATGAAVAGAHVNLGLVEKLHDF